MNEVMEEKKENVNGSEEKGEKENEKEEEDKDGDGEEEDPVTIKLEPATAADLNEKYKILISEYKFQILTLDIDPLEVAKRLEAQKVISKMDLNYINSLTLNKWQMETLYQFLLDAPCDQLNQIKSALKHYNDGTDGLYKVFEEISIRGQHFLRNAFARDKEGSKSQLITRGYPEAASATETWLPDQFYDAVYNGNLNLLVEVFAHVTSLQALLELMAGSEWEFNDGNRVSALHVACGMGGINLKFLQCFTQLIQMLVDSEAGTSKPARLIKILKSKSKSKSDQTKAPAQNFVELRQLEDFLNLPDSHGETALHWAGKAQATELATYLYIKRADLFIENDDGDTPMEIFYEMSPEVILRILNDCVPVMSSTKNENRDEKEVHLDMVAVTGCRSRAIGQSKEQKTVDAVETQQLAQMVLGKMEDSSKQILPHVLVKTFLDEKWKKLVAPIFMLTMTYIMFHLLHTVFLIQVFIVAHPYHSFNETETVNEDVGLTGANHDHNQNSSEKQLDFYNYLLGNWHNTESTFSTDTSQLSKDLALATQITAVVMIVAESFEIWATALCVTHKKEGRADTKSHRKWVARRKMDLVILILLTSIYEHDTLRVLVAGIFLLPLYIYDWILVTSNCKKERISGNTLKNIVIIVTCKIIKISLSISIIILATLTPEPYSKATWFTISLACFCLLIEISKIIQNFISTCFNICADLWQRFSCSCRRKSGQRSLGKSLDGQEQDGTQNIPLVGVQVEGKGEEKIQNHDEKKEENVVVENGQTNDGMDNFVNFLFTFWKGTMAYLTNLENAMQLIYLGIIIFLSESVQRGTLNKGLYRGAAVTVVLAWILILLQIGHIYGLGKYIHMLRTVVKSFLAVMGTYLSLLVAFSLSFSIVFPQEARFESLPSSFFRVVSMMAGELNYDDIFHPDGSEVETNSFPYASQWLHLVFVLAVVIVLINLLIGLTVSDIQKIEEKSDVIYRSVQVERLYIMEMYFKIFSKICYFCCCCCPIRCSTFNVLRESSTKMPIQWDKISPALYAEFGRKRKELDEAITSALPTTEESPDSDPDEKATLDNISLRICDLFQDRDEISNFPLHWLTALAADKDAQEKIRSISHKKPLTANECNLRHLSILSKFSLKSLKELTISLEKIQQRCKGGKKVWAECSEILFDLLIQNRQTLQRVELNWDDLPVDKCKEFPQLNQVIELVFINGSPTKRRKIPIKILDPVPASDIQTLQKNFDFYKKFPKTLAIEIWGAFRNLQNLIDSVFPHIFQKPHNGFKRIKILKLFDEETDEDEVIGTKVLETLSEIFPKIRQLEINGGLRRIVGREDLVPKFWPKLKLVQLSGELWLKAQEGEVSGVTPWGGPLPPADDSRSDRRSTVTSDGQRGGIGSRLAGRFFNFWNKPAHEEEYELAGNGMGYILIINNVFDDPSQKDNINYIHLERKGAREDALKIDRLFRDLNFRTRIEENVNSYELEGILEDFKQECVRYDYHSCFVFVMTYGGWDNLLMNDLVPIDLVKDLVVRMSTKCASSNDDDVFEDDEDEAVGLKNVPKVFFVQCSQYYADEDLSTPFGSQLSIPTIFGDNEVINTRICHALYPWVCNLPTRGQTDGDASLFVEAIDNIFRRNGASSNLKDMIQMVQTEVNEVSRGEGPLVKILDSGFNRQYKFLNVKRKL